MEDEELSNRNLEDGSNAGQTTGTRKMVGIGMGKGIQCWQLSQRRMNLHSNEGGDRRVRGVYLGLAEGVWRRCGLV
jgi:hypothetical protein